MKSVTQRNGEAEKEEVTETPFAATLSPAPVLHVIWLLALSIFILAGAEMASFHGDEAMQITMSADYDTAFIQRQPGALAVSPPYLTDSPEQLRLINGSINRYTIGLSRHLAGMSARDLPGIWQWPLSYDENVARGNRPSDALLNAARMPSALFVAVSAAVLFGIGWRLGGAGLAYIASGLYALNPVILLNGRRAMQEGSFLCFGLLTILIAIVIRQQMNSTALEGKQGRDVSRRYGIFLWGGLIAAGGLTLASKHSGIVFVAGALGWIAITSIHVLFNHTAGFRIWEGQRPSPTTALARIVMPIFVSGILTVVMFITLSPGLWNDPAARLGDLVSERGKLLDSQVIANGATHLHERTAGIITQPFMTPVEHFEAGFWANAKPIQTEIQRYMASPLSGVQFGIVVGGALTLLAGVGIIVCVMGYTGQALSLQRWGMLAWLGVTTASLLVNPLPWQRYYLPLIPVVTLLAGIGIVTAIRFVQNRSQSKSPLVGSENVPQT